MNLAGKCQGFFHCGSLSAWSEHDTVIVAIVFAVITVIGWLIRR